MVGLALPAQGCHTSRGQGCRTCRSSRSGKPGHSCSCKESLGMQHPQSRSPSQQSGCLVVPVPDFSQPCIATLWQEPSFAVPKGWFLVASAFLVCSVGLRAEFRVRCEEETSYRLLLCLSQILQVPTPHLHVLPAWWEMSPVVAVACGCSCCGFCAGFRTDPGSLGAT